ncbi:MAG: hypothetical protein HQL51_13820 [Magnetococcales bacterium]|nr:hypothetical protein [Magnetococcales bacterium]
MTQCPHPVGKRPWRPQPGPFRHLARMTMARMAEVRKIPDLRQQLHAWNRMLNELGEEVERMYNLTLHPESAPVSSQGRGSCNAPSTP